MREIPLKEVDDIYAKNKGTFDCNPCRHCALNFTQGHSLMEHQKFACKKRKTEVNLAASLMSNREVFAKSNVSRHELNAAMANKNACPAITAVEFLTMREIPLKEVDDIYAKNKGTFDCNPCRHCALNFTQGHSLMEHQKFACKKRKTEVNLAASLMSNREVFAKSNVSRHELNAWLDEQEQEQKPFKSLEALDPLPRIPY